MTKFIKFDTSPKDHQSVLQGSSSTDNVVARTVERSRPLLDASDRIRELVPDVPDLKNPRVVFVGSQSSGKSTALELVGGVALPRGDGMVTTRPIENRFRRSDTKSIAIRDGTDGTPIPLSSTNEIGDKVKSLMSAKISENPVFVTVHGPDVPDLTLVDMPGVVQANLGKGTQEDIVDATKSLTVKMIEDDSTIIVYVVPADQDIASDACGALVRAADPSGERTVIALTKADRVEEASRQHVAGIIATIDEREDAGDFSNHLGVFLLRGRTPEELKIGVDIAEIRKREKKFLDEAFGGLVARSVLGSSQLSESVSRLLVARISEHLPALCSKLEETLAMYEAKLERLGAAIPNDQAAMMAYVRQLSDLQGMVGNALKGSYGDIDDAMLLAADNGDFFLAARIYDAAQALQKSLVKVAEAIETGDISELAKNLGGGTYGETDLGAVKRFKAGEWVDEASRSVAVFQKQVALHLHNFIGTLLRRRSIPADHEPVIRAAMLKAARQGLSGFESSTKFFLDAQRQPITANEHYFMDIQEAQDDDSPADGLQEQREQQLIAEMNAFNKVNRKVVVDVCLSTVRHHIREAFAAVAADGDDYKQLVDSPDKVEKREIMQKKIKDLKEALQRAQTVL